VSPDLAFSIGLLAGWTALVIHLVWKSKPTHDCHNPKCPQYIKEHTPPPPPTERPDPFDDWTGKRFDK